MAELEGSSQKKRQGGFGLFKPPASSRRSRRRSRSSTTALPSSSQLPAQPAHPAPTLDLPTFRETGSRITSQMGGSKKASNNRKKRSNLFGWLLGQRSDRRSKRTRRTTSLPSSSLAYPAEGTSRTLVPFPVASRAVSNSRRRRRSPGTQLQGTEPTVMQQPTLLQPPATTLQGVDAGAETRPARSSRRVERGGPLPLRSRSTALTLYIARMLILSIGVGVLAGTVLSAWNPGNKLFLADVSRQPVKQIESPAPASSPTHMATPVGFTTEIAPLKAKLQTLMQQTPGFTPGLFLVDLDNYNYVDLSGSITFPAASMIKVPILIAFFQDVDAGKIRLDDKLTMSKEMIAQGSGEMQSMPPGSQFTALETATQMIIVSDNTATNMLIARLGGIAALNERFKSWGLTGTSLKNLLPDLDGTNVASPKELAILMVRVSQGELVSMRSRDRLLNIMQRTVNNSQIPQGLGEGATIAHKTGDIGTLIGDVGLVDMPNGKRYVAAVMVKRAFNDDRAYDLVQKMSSVIYQHLNGAAKTGRPSASTLSPSPSTSPNSEEQGAETDLQHNLNDAQSIPNDSQHTPDSELNPADGGHQETNPDQTPHQ